MVLISWLCVTLVDFMVFWLALVDFIGTVVGPRGPLFCLRYVSRLNVMLHNYVSLFDFTLCYVICLHVTLFAYIIT